MAELTIIIPLYNRAKLVIRALESICSQDPAQKVIVVDDASIDESYSVVSAYARSRKNIEIVRHRENRGVGPARNSGVSVSRTDWVAFLDSDDELTPGGLEAIRTAIGSSPGHIGALWFRCITDDNRVSPPFVPPNELDYNEYLSFLERSFGKDKDMLKCCRRHTFDLIRYTDSPAFEDLYHLDFARKFNSRIYADIVRSYHQDAGNQLVATKARLDIDDQAFLGAMRSMLMELLKGHGRSLRDQAPRVFYSYVLRLMTVNINLKDRRSATILATKLLRGGHLGMREGLLYLLGMISPTMLNTLRNKVRRKTS
jgi:glycosyltransferase involved in cell wall biosynthesis